MKFLKILEIFKKYSKSNLKSFDENNLKNKIYKICHKPLKHPSKNLRKTIIVFLLKFLPFLGITLQMLSCYFFKYIWWIYLLL